MQALKNRV